jgi:hypothetical protein
MWVIVRRAITLCLTAPWGSFGICNGLWGTQPKTAHTTQSFNWRASTTRQQLQERPTRRGYETHGQERRAKYLQQLHNDIAPAEGRQEIYKAARRLEVDFNGQKMSSPERRISDAFRNSLERLNSQTKLKCNADLRDRLLQQREARHPRGG